MKIKIILHRPKLKALMKYQTPPPRFESSIAPRKRGRNSEFALLKKLLNYNLV